MTHHGGVRLGTAVSTAAFAVLLLGSPIEGQLSVGANLPLFSSPDACPTSTFGAFQVGFEGGLGGVDGQVEAFYGPDGTYAWPWHPDVESVGIGGVDGGGQAAPVGYDYSGGLRISGNVLIGVTEIGRMQVKVLGGAGFRRLSGADYEPGGSGEQEAFGVESTLDPLVTYGAVADIGLTDRTGIRLQFRGTTLFQGDLQLLGPNGAGPVLPSVTQTFGSAIVGFTFDLGSGRAARGQ